MSPLLSGLASVASLVFNAASSGAAKPAAPRRGSDAEQAQPSAVVTLSPQAEALAGFAGKGILVSQGKLDGALGAVQRGSGGGLVGQPSAGGSVSTQDFKALLSEFGADDAQKEQIAAGFDTSKDGRISHEEFLQGLASTSITRQGNDFSQAVLQLMDRSGIADGVVSQSEFAALATAFANAEKRVGAA
ncbi:EF-hand domain-containing protein [Acidovorax sp. NB1]|uniref:EF-hand domain-containing protein n=1 Tax=Acidovorax sp. NB1 TaxID=1943571 RepID=UPI0010E5BA9F|nr:EF-hand domain-containing protein [Acidovorax sp. NB1]GDY38389.1 hypothetical protein ACINB_42810 [Acidovorax sp. NB1]